MSMKQSLAVGVALIGMLIGGSGAVRADGPDACRKSTLAWRAARGADRSAGTAERRLRPRDVGHGRQPRRRGVRRRVHRRRSRRSVARQPRHLRAEGQHRQRVQPARPRAVDGQSLHRGAAGGSLFGLQASNPVDTGVAYGGNPANYGQPNDPMVGGRIGGVNVFGGGLALYNAERHARWRASASAATRRAPITTSPGGRATP